LDSITESSKASIKNQPPTPMLLPVLAWVAGILCGRYLGLPANYYLWFGIGVFVASVIFKRIRVLLILLLFFSFGALRFLENQPKPSPLMLALLEKGEVQQQMQFRVENRLAERVFQARLQSIAGISAHEKVLLYSDHALIPGATTPRWLFCSRRIRILCWIFIRSASTPS
jgi:hypothetical protein